jgi:hypothetical protein
VNVEALRAPKQDDATQSAKIIPPADPKSMDPKSCH